MLLGILALALALRLGFHLWHWQDFRITGDALNYQLMSHQWVEDGVYGYALKRFSGEPNAYVTPGYPAFLSAVYYFVRDPYLQVTVARLVQVAVGTASVGLGFLFVRRLLKRTDVALATAFLMAIYPPFVQSPVQLLTEVWSLATMLLYFWLTVWGLESRNPWVNAGAGLALAAQALIRPVLLPLAPLPFLYLLFRKGWSSWPTVARLIGFTLAGFFPLMLVWWVRNAVTLDALILTATGSANPLLAGTYPNMEGVLEDFAASGLSSEDQGSFARERIIRGFTEEPLRYLRWYTVGKIQFMFESPWLYQQLAERPRLMEFALRLHDFLAWLGLGGLVVGVLRSRILRFVVVYAALFLVLYLIFIPTTRYAYQLMFFVLMGAGYLAASAVDVVRRRRAPLPQ